MSGTPIGVIVIPSDFLPYKFPRMMSLYWMDEAGTKSITPTTLSVDPYGISGLLSMSGQIPITDNTSLSVTSASYGYMPSDKFSGTQSYIDSKSKYQTNLNRIPSPYHENVLYSSYLTQGFSNYCGLENTKILYEILQTGAGLAYNFKDGLSNLQYYIPSISELAFIMPRYNEIYSSISLCGGNLEDAGIYSCSGTSPHIYALNTNDGNINKGPMTQSGGSVRPFCLIQ